MNSKAAKTIRILLKTSFFFVLIAAGAALFFHFVQNRPEVKKQRKRDVQPVYVETRPIEKTDASLKVSAMGTVSPKREINLKPSVSGTVTSVSEHFHPGGIVRKGDLLVTIEQTDYRIAVKKAQAALQQAKADLEQERGQQESARKELEYYEKSGMDRVADKALVLRKPQLEKAKARVASAQADLEQAKTDLSRTRIKAPFNAIITQTSVNLGSYVSSQQELATLYGTETYRIKASVPPDKLDALERSGRDRPKAVITSQTRNFQWTGRVKGPTGRTLENSRMAEILVEVDDPLGLETGDPALLSDEYVSLEILAGERRDVIAVGRKHIRDNRSVWILKDGRLDIRRIEPFWKNRENVLIDKGVSPGEHLITSDISIPVQGMPLKRKPSGNGGTLLPDSPENRKSGNTQE
ncbi:MAG: efflux RND transporter periplasmic adaptor subunit [Desulfarculaceae bacterium]|nr:efflux RND transporter periplasmic adaptor subunit [Desulfarculaceae bacterium]